LIVVDASVLANAVGDDGADGTRARDALAGQDLSVPDLVDVEVVSVLRRRWLAKTLSARRFAAAVTDLTALPPDRYPVLPFLPRAYELRATVSAYDATYVALAEQLDCPLITADARIGAAPGPRCAISVLEREPAALTAGERFNATRRRARPRRATTLMNDGGT
jgi:predicted nucleic acid-binding protein